MFSNKLADLDDFLAPSLECIKPVATVATDSNTAVLNLNDVSATSKSQAFSLVTSTAPKEKPRPNLIKAGADKIA